MRGLSKLVASGILCVLPNLVLVQTASASVVILNDSVPTVVFQDKEEIVVGKCRKSSQAQFPIVNSLKDCDSIDESFRLNQSHLDNLIYTNVLFYPENFDDRYQIENFKENEDELLYKMFRLISRKAQVDERIKKIKYYIEQGGGDQAKQELRDLESEQSDIEGELKDRDISFIQNLSSSIIETISLIKDSKFYTMGKSSFTYQAFAYSRKWDSPLCGTNFLVYLNDMMTKPVGKSGTEMVEARSKDCRGVGSKLKTEGTGWNLYAQILDVKGNKIVPFLRSDSTKQIVSTMGYNVHTAIFYEDQNDITRQFYSAIAGLNQICTNSAILKSFGELRFGAIRSEEALTSLVNVNGLSIPNDYFKLVFDQRETTSGVVTYKRKGSTTVKVRDNFNVEYLLVLNKGKVEKIPTFWYSVSFVTMDRGVYRDYDSSAKLDDPRMDEMYRQDKTSEHQLVGLCGGTF